VSAPKHTPGPWHIVSGGAAIWAGQDHGRVCLRPNHSKVWNWDANARLIAAAPELLEALQETREEIADTRGSVFESHVDPRTGKIPEYHPEARATITDLDQILGRIDDVIAKVTGSAS